MKTNPIDRYLNEVSWAMGGTLAEQQAARDELRAHIEDGARELQLQGMAADEAVRRALRDLGDAETVGRSMRGSRGGTSLRRPLVQPAGALILQRRRDVRLPARALVLALGASAITSAAVGLTYLWPG
jgi:hypothetical protein